MARPDKEAVVQEVVEILEKAKGIFITDFKGLNVEKMVELRNRCREASVSYRVVKNSLARLAAKQAGWEEMVVHFQGPSAIAYSFDDPSAPARIVTKFAETVKKPTIRASILEGNFYGPEKVKMIASLPAKDQLIAQLIGGLNAPIQGLVGGLGGLIQKFVMTLGAVKNSKEE